MCVYFDYSVCVCVCIVLCVFMCLMDVVIVGEILQDFVCECLILFFTFILNG